MNLLIAMSLSGTVPLAVYCLMRLSAKEVSRNCRMVLLKISMLFFLCPFQRLKYRIHMPDFFYRPDVGIRHYLNLPGHVALPTSADCYSLVPVWLLAAAAVWLLVTFIFVVFQTVKYCRLKKMIKNTSDIIQEEGGCLCMKNTHLKTPFTIGIWKSWIIVPDTDLDETSKRMIYTHEMTHIKNKDILMKFICLIIVLLHWFNPASWFLLYEYGVLSEYICDEAVTAQFPEKEERRNYARLLVELSTKEKKIPVVFADYLSGREKQVKRMKRRLDAILHPDKRKMKYFPLIVISVFLCSATTILAYERPWSAPKEYMLNAAEGTFIWFDEEPMAFLDFKESPLFYVDDATGEQMNLDPAAENEARADCNHNKFTTGTIYEHLPNSSGGCVIKGYSAKKCTECNYYITLERVNTVTYTVCTH